MAMVWGFFKALGVSSFIFMMHLWSALAWAQQADPSVRSSVPRISAQSDYVDGPTLCASVASHEQGTWVSAQNFKGQSVNIYTHFVNGFKPELPTILYFTGGPGGHSHYLHAQGRIATSMGYNLLAFDSRGVGCSRPLREEEYLDPNFYSSSHIVSDAMAILNHFNLDRVTVWGASYGTVTASLFAHTYPGLVKALILEGVFYRFKATGHMQSLIEKFWSELHPEAQKKIEEYHLDSNLRNAPNPVFEVLREISLNHGLYGQQKFISYLNEHAQDLVVKREILSLWAKKALPSGTPFVSAGIEMLAPFAVDSHVYNVMLAKELGRCTRDFNTVSYKIHKGQIIPLMQTEDEDTTIACNELAARNYISSFNLTEIDKEYLDDENFVIHYEKDISLLFYQKKFYSFGDVPSLYDPASLTLQVPVYYLNGTHDLATPLDLAWKHFEDIRGLHAQRYFLAFEGLGHHPVLEAYNISNSATEAACMDELLKKMFAGQELQNAVSTQCASERLSNYRVQMHLQSPKL